MKKTCIHTALCLSTLLVGSSASAAYFDLNKANLGVAGGTAYDLVQMSVAGISVDITAITLDNNGSGAINSISPLSGGPGVYVSSTTSGNIGVLSNLTGDGTNLDGGFTSTDLDEGLVFSFSQVVSLDFLNLDSFSGGDDFNLTVDGITYLVDHNASDVSPFVTNAATTDKFFIHNITGTDFIIWADGDSDSFRVGGLDVSAVPVPAAIWLFASGLLGLVGLSRRK